MEPTTDFNYHPSTVGSAPQLSHNHDSSSSSINIRWLMELVSPRLDQGLTLALAASRGLPVPHAAPVSPPMPVSHDSVAPEDPSYSLSPERQLAAAASMPCPRKALACLVQDRVQHAAFLRSLSEYVINTVFRLDRTGENLVATTLLARLQPLHTFGLPVDRHVYIVPSIDSVFHHLHHQALEYLSDYLECDLPALRGISLAYSVSPSSKDYVITRHFTRKGATIIVGQKRGAAVQQLRSRRSHEAK